MATSLNHKNKFKSASVADLFMQKVEEKKKPKGFWKQKYYFWFQRFKGTHNSIRSSNST